MEVTSLQLTRVLFFETTSWWWQCSFLQRPFELAHYMYDHTIIVQIWNCVKAIFGSCTAYVRLSLISIENQEIIRTLTLRHCYAQDTYAAPVYNSSGYVVGTSGAVQPSQYQHHHQPYHGCYHPSAGYISPHTHAHPSPYGSSPYGAAHAAPSAPQISASPPSHMLTYSPLHQPVSLCWFHFVTNTFYSFPRTLWCQESSDKLFPSTSTTIPPNIGLPHISVLDSSTASSPNIGANQEADAHSASPNKPLSSPVRTTLWPFNTFHRAYFKASSHTRCQYLLNSFFLATVAQ